MAPMVVFFFPVKWPVFIFDDAWLAAEDIVGEIVLVDEGCVMMVWLKGMSRPFRIVTTIDL